MFIAIGGPQAHVTLSMTATLFQQPASLGGRVRPCHITGYPSGGLHTFALRKNVGGRRSLVACSKAKASLMSVGSL